MVGRRPPPQKWRINPHRRGESSAAVVAQNLFPKPKELQKTETGSLLTCGMLVGIVSFMDIDFILSVFNRCGVRYLLIGGVNFLLRHKPVLTFDVDFWLEDTADNLRRCEAAMVELEAQWGPTDSEWKPVADWPSGWLSRQPLFCLTSPHGALDLFHSVRGLTDWQASFKESVEGRTASGILYRGLSDADMLKCQLSLAPESRKEDRIRELQRALHES
jgi:hypothetical protein